MRVEFLVVCVRVHRIPVSHGRSYSSTGSVPYRTWHAEGRTGRVVVDETALLLMVWKRYVYLGGGAHRHVDTPVPQR